MQRRHWMQGLIATAAAGSSLDAMAAPAPAPVPVPTPPARKRWALVLGGGTARGLAHIGVLKVLQAEGLQPDLVVGCSAGALVGAFYAAGFSPRQMEELALSVKDSEIVDLVEGNKRGMVTGDALQSFVNKQLRQLPIEQFKLPYAAVATNLATGEPMVFRKGDAGQAVRASSSIPAIFIPARIGDQDFVDGGLTSPVPVRIARSLGVDQVVAVTVSAGPQPARPEGLFELLMQSFDIMAGALTQLELRDADVVIRPALARMSFMDFGSRHQMILLGEQAARQALPALRAKLRLKA